MTTMADLTPGTRVRHVTWGDKGTIIRRGIRAWMKLDGMSPPAEVREGGLIEPQDLEIIGEDP